jgi:hypothetical protein
MTPSPFPSAVPASSPPPVAGKLGRWGVWLRRFSSRRWFLPAAGGVTSGDYFLPILPTQTLLIATTLLHPGRWRWVAFWFVVGGVAGGTALAAVIGSWGPELAGRLFGEAMTGENWLRLQAIIQDHGAWALLALTAFPWPMRSGVAICALAGVPLFQIALALIAGRTIAFGGLAFLVSRSPAWLRRIPFFARLRAEVNRLETQRGASDTPSPKTASFATTLLIVHALTLAAPSLHAAGFSGEAVLDDQRRFSVIQTQPTPGEHNRVYRATDGAVIVEESVVFGGNLAAGVQSGRFEDKAAGIILTVSTQQARRTFVLEQTGGVTRTHEEPTDEPLLTAAAAPAWILAHWDALAAGENQNARFPITKAGKTLGIKITLKLDAQGGAKVTLKPRNPVFGLLANSLVFTFDPQRRLIGQSGLIEPLTGKPGKPALQSGRITWSPSSP